MKQAMSKTLGMFRALESLITEAEHQGNTATIAGVFRTVLGEILEINMKVEKLFPPLNMELVEESIAAFKRGEYQTIEELIRETQGIGVVTH